MITGRNPSYDTGGNLRLDDVKLELPEGIRTILTKMLAIRVARRYQSCEEALLAYEEFEKNYYEPKPRKIIPQPEIPKEEKSNTVMIDLIAGVALVVTVILTLYFSGFFN